MGAFVLFELSLTNTNTNSIRTNPNNNPMRSILKLSLQQLCSSAGSFGWKTKEHEFKFKRWSYIPRHLAAERIFSLNKSKTKEQNKGAKGKQRSMNSSLRDRATSQDI